MKKVIIVALPFVILVAALVSYGFIPAPTFTEQHTDVWSEHWGKIAKTKGSTWTFIPGRIYTRPLEEGAYDVTITFSGEFVVFNVMVHMLDHERIELQCIIQVYNKSWVWFSRAKPWKAVIRTEQLDWTAENWESRSFTFIYNGLPGGAKYRFGIKWRLYPAFSIWTEAQVRRRSLVVTLNTAGH